MDLPGLEQRTHGVVCHLLEGLVVLAEHDKTVSACRAATCGISAPDYTGADGRQYPAKHNAPALMPASQCAIPLRWAHTVKSVDEESL
ncbi:MAG: hypothetical protein ACMG6H_12625, partial [Acidobacteriota bacterium]